MQLTPRTGWIGIDIGTHAVKVAQVERTTSGMRLQRAVAIQRPEPWPAADRLPAARALPSLGQVAAARQAAGALRGRRAACGLPMSVCELRGLRIPAGDVRQRRAMIASELAEDWAECATPVEFDYWEVDPPRSPGSDDATNVHVVSVPRPWIDQLADDCRHARLDCWAVDAAPVALARAVALAEPTPTNQPRLAIDWGFQNATLVVTAGGHALYTRSLRDCQLSRIIDAVQTQLGVTRDEAIHLLTQHGLVGTSADDGDDLDVRRAITVAAASSVETLVREVTRTMEFLEQSRPPWLPDRVVLAGGGACVAHVDKLLSEKLELPVRAWTLSRTEYTEADYGSTALFAHAAALSALAWGPQ